MSFQTRVLSYSDVRPTTSVLHHPLDRMLLDRNYMDYRLVYQDEAILSTGAYTTAVKSRAVAHASPAYTQALAPVELTPLERLNVGAAVVYNPNPAVRSRVLAHASPLYTQALTPLERLNGGATVVYNPRVRVRPDMQSAPAPHSTPYYTELDQEIASKPHGAWSRPCLLDSHGHCCLPEWHDHTDSPSPGPRSKPSALHSGECWGGEHGLCAAYHSRAVAIEGVHYPFDGVHYPYGNEDRHLRGGGSSGSSPALKAYERGKK